MEGKQETEETEETVFTRRHGGTETHGELLKDNDGQQRAAALPCLLFNRHLRDFRGHHRS